MNKALELTSECETWPGVFHKEVAEELRRLDKVEAELVETLKQIKAAAGATVCNIEWVEQHAAKVLASTPAPAQQNQKPVAWFDSNGKLQGRMSAEQLEQLCREGIAQMRAINGSSLCTPKGGSNEHTETATAA